jgi:hypothetical protein
MGFFDRIRNFFKAASQPESYVPPPIPSAPMREPEGFTAPSISYVSRGDLPDEWGRNEAALWQDATRTNDALANDSIAQMYYDAALYTFSDTPEDRAHAIEMLKQYIWDEYGIDWDEVFDWESFREAYEGAHS